MAAIEVPFVPSIGAYRFTTVIETKQYVFDVRWNTRDAAWYFDVLDADESPIVKSIKVVLGAYLGRLSHHPLFTNGVMVAVDLSGQELDATFDDFGTRVAIQYIPVLDLIVRIKSLPVT